jgi:hypothetical protein
MATTFPRFNSARFFLLGFINGKVYYPPLPAYADDLSARITGAVTEVAPEMLRDTREGIHYMWDIYCGGHIEL